MIPDVSTPGVPTTWTVAGGQGGELGAEGAAVRERSVVDVLITMAALVTGFLASVLWRTRRDLRDARSRVGMLQSKRWSDLEVLIYAALVLLVLTALIRN